MSETKYDTVHAQCLWIELNYSSFPFYHLRMWSKSKAKVKCDLGLGFNLFTTTKLHLRCQLERSPFKEATENVDLESNSWNQFSYTASVTFVQYERKSFLGIFKHISSFFALDSWVKEGDARGAEGLSCPSKHISREYYKEM